MSFIHLEPNQVPAHLKRDYDGRKFKAKAATSVTIPMDAGLWSGATRTTYEMIELATGNKLPAVNHMAAPFNTSRKDKVIDLAPGYAIVMHTIFQGTDMGLTFYVHPENASLLITDKSETLTDNEKLVLDATRSLKSSYNGKDRYQMKRDEHSFKRDTEPFMPRAQWDDAKLTLMSKGMLDKRGAITVKGRNASR